MEGLAKPDYKNRVVTNDGYNTDIITTLNNAFPEALKQVKNVKIGGDNEYQKGRAIFNYLKYSIKYKKDPSGKQVIQLPARMIGDTRSGDCKSKALAAAALMHTNGFKDVSLRYASYDNRDKTPTHVYAVGKDSNNTEIIIDPVWKVYNTQAPYQYKKDYPMQISVISGVIEREGSINPTNATSKPKKQYKANYISKLNSLLQKVKAGGILHNVIVNEMARQQGKALTENYSSAQLERYKMFLNKVYNKSSAPVIKDLITKELNLIKSGSFSGHIYLPEGRMAIKGLEEEIGKISLKKLVKKLDPRKALQAAKAVTFFPIRKAFLLLVTLNVRGLAKRLSKLSSGAKTNFWVKKFGGKLSILEGSIKRGLRKKPLFGASKSVKNIKGIGYAVDYSVGDFARSEYVTQLSNREERQVNRENKSNVKQAGNFNTGSLLSAGAGTAAAVTAANPGSAATIASIIAAAAPILVAITSAFKKEGIQEVPEAAGQPESSDFKETASEGNTGLNKLESFVEQAANTATKLGIIPEPKETTEASNVNNVVGADTSEEDVAAGGDRSLAPSLSKIPMPLVIGGAALVGYLLLKKKK